MAGKVKKLSVTDPRPYLSWPRGRREYKEKKAIGQLRIHPHRDTEGRKKTFKKRVREGGLSNNAISTYSLQAFAKKKGGRLKRKRKVRRGGKHRSAICMNLIAEWNADCSGEGGGEKKKAGEKKREETAEPHSVQSCSPLFR